MRGIHLLLLPHSSPCPAASDAVLPLRSSRASRRRSDGHGRRPPPSGAVCQWTKLISGHAKARRGRQALALFARMREVGPPPNNYTYVAALQACAAIPDLEAGRGVHAQAMESGWGSDVYVATALVTMYARCGGAREADRVFEGMKHRNVVTWNAMIIGLVHLDMGGSALRLYRRMLDEGFVPDDRTFPAALKACGGLASRGGGEGGKGGGHTKPSCHLRQGRALHAELAKGGFESDVFVASALIDMYAKCGSIRDARGAFEKLTGRHNIVSWTAMMMGYVHAGMGDCALGLYGRLGSEGLTPNSCTFIAALKACTCPAAREEHEGVETGSAGRTYLEQGRAIHAEVARRGLESDLFVASALVDMYVKCGDAGAARRVFEKMAHRDVVSWNAMITGYAQVEMGDSALELYTRMQDEGFAPDGWTFVAVLKACSSQAAREEGGGVEASVTKARFLDRGRAIHIELAKRGLGSDVFVANALVDMYVKCGGMGDACEVFANMRHRDVVSWNTMIMGYIQMERGDLALESYEQMKSDGFTPDARTFVAALKACGSLAMQEGGEDVDGGAIKTGCLKRGRAIHFELLERGFESATIVANALLDMYVKCGSVKDACRVFEEMIRRDVVSWTTIITGYAQAEMGNSALELFSHMQEEGFTPSTHTFVAVLKACGSLGSLEVGNEVRSQIHVLELQNQPFVANSLIDMYGKCGSMGHAQEFFDSLLVRSSVTWNALIAGYSDQGDCERLFEVYERMLLEGVKPDAITFVSVLSVCSHNGLVETGQMYFQAMCSEHGISPSSKHFMCMTDLLGRAGQLDVAVAMLAMMPFDPNKVTWMTILGACRKWNNVETGRNCFECVVMLDRKFVAAYVSMMNIYVSAQMWGECAKIQEIKMRSRA